MSYASASQSNLESTPKASELTFLPEEEEGIPDIITKVGDYSSLEEYTIKNTNGMPF